MNAVRLQVEVADDHLIPLGFPNMWTVFKVVDRVTGEPVAGPDIQVAPPHSIPKAKESKFRPNNSKESDWQNLFVFFCQTGPEQVAKLLLEVDFLPFLDKLIYKNYKH